MQQGYSNKQRIDLPLDFFIYIISIRLFQETKSSQMSLNLQNLTKKDNNHKDTTQKNYKAVMDRHFESNSPCEETQRMFQIKHIPSKDMDIGQTQRNYQQSKNKVLVWLTQSKQKSQKDSNWSIKFQSSHKEHIDEIYHLLQRQNLAEIFQAFEDLRFIISQEISQGVTGKHTIELLQAIQCLKNKINRIKGHKQLQLRQESQQQQLKQLLRQCIRLRAENAQLKQRMQQINKQLERQRLNISNSILNNSISFQSCHSSQSHDISNQSYSITIQQQLIRPFFANKQILQESTLGLLSSSVEQPKQIKSSVHLINSFAVTPHHQQAQTQQSHQFCNEETKWIQLVEQLIKDMKKLFSYYLQAANLALIHNQIKLNQFKQLLKTLHSQKHNSDSFFEQTRHFTTHIMSFSLTLNQIIQSSFINTKFKCNQSNS